MRGSGLTLSRLTNTLVRTWTMVIDARDRKAC
jgi:hypothetical protein